MVDNNNHNVEDCSFQLTKNSIISKFLFNLDCSSCISLFSPSCFFMILVIYINMSLASLRANNAAAILRITISHSREDKFNFAPACESMGSAPAPAQGNYEIMQKRRPNCSHAHTDGETRPKLKNSRLITKVRFKTVSILM